MIDLEKYYVYEHWKDNKCFYVGKGRGDRAFSYFRSNKEWSKVFNDPFEWYSNCFDYIKFIKNFEDENEAYKFEKEQSILRINQGHSLVNKSLGKSVIWTDEMKNNLKKKYESGEIVNHFKGKKHSQESIEKIKRAAKNRPFRKIICKNCEKEYESNASRTWYCSHSCKLESLKERRKKKV